MGAVRMSDGAGHARQEVESAHHQHRFTPEGTEVREEERRSAQCMYRQVHIPSSSLRRLRKQTIQAGPDA